MYMPFTYSFAYRLIDLIFKKGDAFISSISLFVVWCNVLLTLVDALVISPEIVLSKLFESDEYVCVLFESVTLFFFKTSFFLFG